MSKELLIEMDDAEYDFMQCTGLDDIGGLVPELGVNLEEQREIARKQAYEEDLYFANPKVKYWTPQNVGQSSILSIHFCFFSLSPLFHSRFSHCLWSTDWKFQIVRVAEKVDKSELEGNCTWPESIIRITGP